MTRSRDATGRIRRSALPSIDESSGESPPRSSVSRTTEPINIETAETLATSRRAFLTFLGTLSITACGASRRALAWVGDEPSPPVVLPAAHEAMDEALEMLAPYAPHYRGGLSNHGPMTAEALVAMGHHEAVKGWVANYRKRLETRPASKKRIEAKQWREALGDGERSRDWDEFFTHELAESPWQKVIERWVPRLAPGIAAAGLHGVIRVGHAVRSLAVQENAARVDELARALAYWATDFLLLPGSYSGGGKLAPAAALKKIPLLPNDERTSRGLITTELKDLVGFEPFIAVVDLVDPASGTPTFVTDLLATFAGTFVNTNSNSFEFLHAVTGASAIAELLPYVKKEQRAEVLAYAWQVSAGLFSRYARQGLVADVKQDSSLESVEQLTKLAVATGDEHTIKLVSTCTREWLRNPDPRLLAAAAKRLRRRR